MSPDPWIYLTENELDYLNRLLFKNFKEKTEDERNYIIRLSNKIDRIVEGVKRHVPL